jgi:type III pantothenate kinase
MILIGDIGNTSIKLAYFNPVSKKIIKTKSFLTNHFFKNKIFKNYLKLFKYKNCLITSVVPNAFIKLKKFLEKRKIKVYEILEKKILCNIKIDVKKPNQIGSDRIANSIGAISQYKKNCIIIDFGTATTFDVVLKNNRYIGGVISPGIKLSLKALYDFTAKLPEIELKKTKKVIGKDTNSAMQSGTFFGYVSLINGLIEKIIFETNKKFLIILTGGYANLFKNSLNYKCLINQNITLEGVKNILETNKKIFYEKK